MMTRITNAEYSQSVAEMRQRIAELEIEVCRRVYFFAFTFKNCNHTEMCSKTLETGKLTK